VRGAGGGGGRKRAAKTINQKKKFSIAARCGDEERRGKKRLWKKKGKKRAGETTKDFQKAIPKSTDEDGEGKDGGERRSLKEGKGGGKTGWEEGGGARPWVKRVRYSPVPTKGNAKKKFLETNGRGGRLMSRGLRGGGGPLKIKPPSGKGSKKGQKSNSSQF